MSIPGKAQQNAQHPPAKLTRDLGRLETFSDGVFAIAITLLVLEIKVPDGAALAAHGLGSALLAQWPSYFAFVLSFLLIGAYWVNHHALFKLLTHADHCFTLLTLALLLAMSALPFPAAVLGRHLTDPAGIGVAVSLYTGALLFAAGVWAIGWWHASRVGLLRSDLDPTFIRKLRRQYTGSVALHVLALGLALSWPALGMLAATGLALLYLLPPPQLRMLSAPPQL